MKLIRYIKHYLHIIKQFAINKRRIKKAFAACNSDKRIILIGSPEHENIGDHAISIAELKFLKDKLSEYSVVEISGDMARRAGRALEAMVHSDDLVLITGGGLMGDLWIDEQQMIESVIRRLKDNHIVIMPQTVYFNDCSSRLFHDFKQAAENCKSLKLLCRDERSYKFVSENINCDAYYFPDMVLYLDGFAGEGSRSGISVCFRSDKEKITENTDKIISRLSEDDTVKPVSTVLDHHIPIEDRLREFENILSEISSTRLLVTDRLHAVLFAYITNTPCIAFDNLSGKVKGVCKWIEAADFIRLVEDYEDFEAAYREMLLTQPVTRVNSLKPIFDDMAKIIVE